MPVTKIISGGQIGADVAGLRAGARLGIETGGWMPLGFRTLSGPRPDLAMLYGLQEHTCQGYPPRTRLNVLESEATLRFAHNFASPGERCTFRYIEEFGRPYMDIPVSQAGIGASHAGVLRNWLRNNDFRIINVAGNADEWIEGYVEAFLIRVITSVNRDAVPPVVDDAPF